MNYQLMNDSVDTLTIVAKDAGGLIEPIPPGDTFTVVSSNPASLEALIVSDKNTNPAVQLRALVQLSPGLTITVSDSAGLTVDVQAVDIVADTKPRDIGLDLANVASTPQPVPTNPGP